MIPRFPLFAIDRAGRRTAGRWNRRVPYAAIAFCLALFIAGGLAGQTASPSLALLSKDGRRALPLTMVNGQEFVALDDLAAVFQLAVHEESPGAITVSYKGRTIVLTSDQALASVSGRLVSLPAPPSRVGRRWAVPVEFISRALALIYDTKLDLRKPSNLLVLGDLRVPRITIRHDVVGAGARLTIDAVPRASMTVSQQNAQLAVHVDADALDIVALPSGLPGPNGIVQAVRTGDSTTIAVELGPRFGAFRAITTPGDTTTRLTIDFVPAQTETGQAPNAAAGSAAPPAGASSPGAAPPPPPLPQDLTAASFRTVVIDPGHGGDDEGARGANGTKEKDVTLAVARRLKGLIEGRLGLRAILTREDDRAVPLDSRTAAANNNKADLFVSLHADTSVRKSTAGASVWYASFGDDATRAAQAARAGAERLPTFGGGQREVELLYWDVAQVQHVDQSAEFTRVVVQLLNGRTPLAPQPVVRAPLAVLEPANMPAVLVNLGYLSNPQQEATLAGAELQGTLAQALFEAVARFRDSVDGSRAPAGASGQPAAMPPRPGGHQ